jgi:para-aminobenzoate synthetase component 1
MRLHSAFLGGWVHPADVFVQFFANEPNAFWLDGEHSPNGRFSIMGTGPLVDIAQDRESSQIAESLGSLRNQNSLELPFNWRPGLVGFLTYEGEPKFILADRAIVFDHENQGLYFVGAFEAETDFDYWHHAALLRLGFAGGQVASYLYERALVGVAERPEVRHDPTSYLSMIETAQQHIAAGDVYQICLTNEILVETVQDPLAVFLRLRQINPAPYSAFIRVEGVSLASSSPEQFIQVSKTGEISTKPIKGTRPRGDSKVEDRAISEKLQRDPKERAENLMIVDLMRNDIGRVSEVGSVSVPKLFDIESYATVHQLVSTVSGKLAEGETAWSAVQAAFPGGSMTGAPKIRAMELIEELERGPRGIYSGCVGYLGADGSAEFAMVIRSIVFEAETARIGVGGGITIDSNPASELEETKLKAMALLNALNATDPWA